MGSSPVADARGTPSAQTVGGSHSIPSFKSIMSALLSYLARLPAFSFILIAVENKRVVEKMSKML